MRAPAGRGSRRGWLVIQCHGLRPRQNPTCSEADTCPSSWGWAAGETGGAGEKGKAAGAPGTAAPWLTWDHTSPPSRHDHDPQCPQAKLWPQKVAGPCEPSPPSQRAGHTGGGQVLAQRAPAQCPAPASAQTGRGSVGRGPGQGGRTRHANWAGSALYLHLTLGMADARGTQSPKQNNEQCGRPARRRGRGAPACSRPTPAPSSLAAVKPLISKTPSGHRLDRE